MSEILRYTCTECGHTRKLAIQYLTQEQIEKLFAHKVTATCNHCMTETLHTTRP